MSDLTYAISNVLSFPRLYSLVHLLYTQLSFEASLSPHFPSYSSSDTLTVYSSRPTRHLPEILLLPHKCLPDRSSVLNSLCQ